MDRTRVSVAGILLFVVVLAGCSGVTGGDANATATPGASPTATVEPTPTPASTPTATPTPDPAPSTLAVRNVSASAHAVMAGRPASIDATVENVGSGTRAQTVELRAAGIISHERTVSLAPGDQTTLSFGLNTSARAPGRYAFTVRTGNDSAVTHVEIGANRTYEQFFDNVTTRTQGVRNTRVFGPDEAGIVFQHTESHFRTFVESDLYMPPPQAVALEMAADPEGSPQRVNLFMRNETGAPVWESNLNQSLAEQYANSSINPREFRAALAATANGPWSDRGPTELKLTWTTGERSRLAYAEELAERLENSSWSHHYTVTDYGIYNDTVRLPDTTRTLDPGEAIYVEIQNPRNIEQVRYRTWNSTKSGAAIFESIYIWGNISNKNNYGELPEVLRLRQVGQNKVPHEINTIPTAWATDVAVGRMSLSEAHFAIAFNDILTTYYDTEGEKIPD